MTTKGNAHAKPELELDPSIARFGRADIAGEPVIDREGGKFGAGIIRGVSLASVGEALGHGMWLDAETIAAVERLSKTKGDTGVKCRFTHPGMSSDGMGKLCGRLFDVRVVDEKAIGDLHFAKSAHSTPDGDLAGYVMDLVEEDPQASGLSIVFHHDSEAEYEFYEANQEEYEDEDYRGRKRTRSRFKSPDPRNERNLHHVRIAELRAADVVDEPAANPDGMFSAVSLPNDADRFLSFVCGISEDKPKASMFGVEPERAAQFLGRWLDSQGLSINPKEPSLATTTNEPTEAPETPVQTREDFAAELEKFTSKFGTENGTKWFSESKTFEEALSLHAEALEARIEAAESAQKEAEEKLSSLELGETEPVATGASSDGKDGPKRFAEFFGKQNKN